MSRSLVISLLCWSFISLAKAQPSSFPATAPASIPSTQISAADGEIPTHKTQPKTPEVTPKNEMISILPLAIRRAGISLQYERQINARPYSIAGALGLRFGARDPLRSTQFALGVECKRWSSLSYWKEKGAFYGVGRLDTGFSRLLDDSAIGSSVLIETHVGVGYRRIIKQVLEVSTASTFGVRTDIDRSGLLPATLTGTLGLWFSVGYLF